MTLNIHTSDPARVDRLAIDYKVAEYIAEISFQGIDNSYKIAERKLLILDSSGIYPANHRTDILLLTQSPKINLIRILDALRPKQIVADGSNYTAYVNRWRQTCLQKKLPFHYTGEKGAYYFSFR
jgi:competence protein ComEC